MSERSERIRTEFIPQDRSQKVRLFFSVQVQVSAPGLRSLAGRRRRRRWRLEGGKGKSDTVSISQVWEKSPQKERERKRERYLHLRRPPARLSTRTLDEFPHKVMTKKIKKNPPSRPVLLTPRSFSFYLLFTIIISSSIIVKAALSGTDRSGGSGLCGSSAVSVVRSARRSSVRSDSSH